MPFCYQGCRTRSLLDDLVQFKLNMELYETGNLDWTASSVVTGTGFNLFSNMLGLQCPADGSIILSKLGNMALDLDVTCSLWMLTYVNLKQ